MRPSRILSIEDLPDQTGSYALLLDLPARRRLTIGAMGEIDFPPGRYVYCGSALGPGGLRARLGRHLHGAGKPRWHIDFFRRHSHPIAFGYALSLTGAHSTREQEKHECRWSQLIARLWQAAIPAPRFGASDCLSACPSHLVALPHNFDLDAVHHALIQITPQLFWQIPISLPNSSDACSENSLAKIPAD